MTTEKVQLTNEQIARVFAMYLNGKVEKGHKPIKMIDPRGNKVIVTLYALSSDREWLRDARLLLTPLSAVSDEDAIEVAKMCRMSGFSHVYNWDVKIKNDYYMILKGLTDGSKQRNDEKMWAELTIHLNGFGLEYIDWRQFDKPKLVSLDMVSQYLIQKGYAVPLFIEPNHPLNGKTAIELGIAIAK